MLKARGARGAETVVFCCVEPQCVHSELRHPDWEKYLFRTKRVFPRNVGLFGPNEGHLSISLSCLITITPFLSWK